MSTGIPTLRRNEPIARRPAPAGPTPAAAAPPAKVKIDVHRVQSETLNELRATRTRVVICTTNRQYVGTIVAFDVYTIRLDSGVLLFKHAVESISPAVVP